MENRVNRATNVLISCAHEKGTGGVQVVLRNLVHGLEQNGWHVDFVAAAPLTTLRTTETINSLGCRVFACPMPTVVKHSLLLSLPVFLAHLPVTLFRLTRLIRRRKVDVINCHYLDPSFVHLVIAARLLRIRVVVSVHGADVDSDGDSSVAHRLVYRLIMRGADRVVACSKALARRTVEVFPGVRDKITYVHNGLDLASYTGLQERRPPALPFVLCVCRHVQKKGVDTLLRAFAQVQREVPALTLVLVGDGPLLLEHKQLARTLQIERQVVFVGNVAHPEVSAFFAECALFVLPSRIEPFGLVLLEAAYYSKAIVATRVGGIPEIIASGANGLLVEPDDPAGMAASILAILRSPELAADLGFQAHQTLMTRFLWKDRILDYISIYEGDPGLSPFDGPRAAPAVQAVRDVEVRAVSIDAFRGPDRMFEKKGDGRAVAARLDAPLVRRRTF